MHEANPSLSEADTGSDTSSQAWRRFFARTIDLSVNAFVLTIVWTYVAGVFAQDTSNFWMQIFTERENLVPSGAITTVFSFLANVPFMAYYRTTLGKWLFGIRVTKPDGKPLGFKLALKREFAIFVRGYFLMIPLLNLITLAVAYETMKDEGQAPWDRDYGLIVNHRPQSIILTLVEASAVILLFVFTLWSILPPDLDKMS